MASFDDLIPDVLQSLFNEGVDEASFNKNRAVYAIRKAYRDFARRTHVFKRTWLFTGQAGVGEYPLYEFENEIVSKIYSVKVNGECYKPAKICSCNCCSNTYHYDGTSLHICPAPECDGAEVEICISVVPTRSACDMDDRVAQLYGQDISSGAVHNLLSKKVSGAYQVEYDAGVAKGAREAARQWAAGARKTKKRTWIRR